MRRTVPLHVTLTATVLAVVATWMLLPRLAPIAAPRQASAAGAPALISYQGFVTDSSGAPHDGYADVRVRLYGTQTSTPVLWEELHDNATVTDGYFTILLGSVEPLSPGHFLESERWLQVSVDTGDGYTDFPRSRVASVPYALQAAQAPWSGVTGVDYVSDVQARVTGSCPTGYYVRAVNVDGTVTCEEVEGVPVGTIVMWSGSIGSIPTGWALCDGTEGTPDLRDRFIVGAGSGYGVGAQGGSSSVSLTTSHLPAHHHSVDPPATYTDDQRPEIRINEAGSGPNQGRWNLDWTPVGVYGSQSQ
jgi:hypothetical protein